MKIERGIPIPPSNQGLQGGGTTALLRSLKPGDSFVTEKFRRNSIASCARSAGIKITIRSLDAKNIRVWRTG